jgi:hypothetical protein
LSAAQWVFGYASLVADHEGHDATLARLPGYRRVWGVATDNVRSIPGYKMYLSRADGSRPRVFVAFLDLEPDPGSMVTGLARRVDDEDLAGLDLRERNYDRIDVTGSVSEVSGRVWTYMGSPEGRARLREGRAKGAAVVSRDYLEKVRAGLRARAVEDPLPDGLPVRDLDRVDLPA